MSYIFNLIGKYDIKSVYKLHIRNRTYFLYLLDFRLQKKINGIVNVSKSIQCTTNRICIVKKNVVYGTFISCIVKM